jgi:hypothetical protein
MNPIKYLLIASFVALLAWAFRNRARVGVRASVRATAVALTALAVMSIVQPDITQRAADLLGVTRGTDLLLYCLIVVFMMTAVGMYFRFKELERRIVQLVRAGALREASQVRDDSPEHVLLMGATQSSEVVSVD